MDNHFRNEERLFRAVLPDEMYWKPDGSLTSAAFKTNEKDGLSTDRDGGRSVEECVRTLAACRAGRIISVSVQNCVDKDALVVYAPVIEPEPNMYHSLIRRSEETVKLSQSQCKYLATQSIVHT